jgi:hypothetical protein
MNRHPACFARLSVALVSLASASLTACSSQNNDHTGSGGTGSGGTGSGGAGSGGKNPGDSVLVPDAQHVIWTNNGGGLIVLPPVGANCPVSARYDLALQGWLAWSICSGSDPTDAGSYTVVTGGRELIGSELSQATAAARAVTISDRVMCGADKPNLTLEIVTPSGSTVYGDDFYACDKQYGQYVISAALDQLGSVLRGMAHSL